MSLTKEEKETIISYNETAEPASVYTFNRALQHKLDKLAQEYPEEVKTASWNPEKCKEYYIPKSWVRIYPPRKISNSRKGKMAEIAKLGRAAQERKRDQ